MTSLVQWTTISDQSNFTECAGQRGELVTRDVSDRIAQRHFGTTVSSLGRKSLGFDQHRQKPGPQIPEAAVFGATRIAGVKQPRFLLIGADKLSHEDCGSPVALPQYIVVALLVSEEFEFLV
jgi:hypothetical protein